MVLTLFFDLDESVFDRVDLVGSSELHYSETCSRSRVRELRYGESICSDSRYDKSPVVRFGFHIFDMYGLSDSETVTMSSEGDRSSGIHRSSDTLRSSYALVEVHFLVIDQRHEDRVYFLVVERAPHSVVGTDWVDYECWEVVFWYENWVAEKYCFHIVER